MGQMPFWHPNKFVRVRKGNAVAVDNKCIIIKIITLIRVTMVVVVVLVAVIAVTFHKLDNYMLCHFGYTVAFHVGYPNENAVHVALKSVRNWLDKLATQNKVNMYCCYMRARLHMTCVNYYWQKLMDHFLFVVILCEIITHADSSDRGTFFTGTCLSVWLSALYLRIRRSCDHQTWHTNVPGNPFILGL